MKSRFFPLPFEGHVRGVSRSVAMVSLDRVSRFVGRRLHRAVKPRSRDPCPTKEVTLEKLELRGSRG